MVRAATLGVNQSARHQMNINQAAGTPGVSKTTGTDREAGCNNFNPKEKPVTGIPHLGK